MSHPGSSPPHAAPVISGSGPLRRLTLEPLASIPGVGHAFTLRDSDPVAILRDLDAGSEPPMRLLRQVHGATVHVVDDGSMPAAGSPPPEGDALVSKCIAVALGIRVADCVPILVFDRRHGVIAAVHAGWRGTAAAVLPAALETMSRRYGSEGRDLVLALGPAIGPCCFEVGDEVIEALRRRDPVASSFVRSGAGRGHVDLVEANRRQARACGVPASQIGASDLCTVCRPDLFWSYRRDGAGAGRMTALIARLRPSP